MKVVLGGDSEAKKTSIVQRLCFPKSHSDLPSLTLGAAGTITQLKISESQTLHLEIWDTAGREAFDCISPMCYRSAGVVILAFPVDDRGLFDCLQFWFEEVQSRSARMPRIILVGHHVGALNEGRKVDTDQAKSFATKIDAHYCKVCAETADGFDTLLNMVADIAREMIRTDLAAAAPVME